MMSSSQQIPSCVLPALFLFLLVVTQSSVLQASSSIHRQEKGEGAVLYEAEVSVVHKNSNTSNEFARGRRRLSGNPSHAEGSSRANQLSPYSAEFQGKADSAATELPLPQASEAAGGSTVSVEPMAAAEEAEERPAKRQKLSTWSRLVSCFVGHKLLMNVCKKELLLSSHVENLYEADPRTLHSTLWPIVNVRRSCGIDRQENMYPILLIPDPEWKEACQTALLDLHRHNHRVLEDVEIIVYAPEYLTISPNIRISELRVDLDAQVKSTTIPVDSILLAPLRKNNYMRRVQETLRIVTQLPKRMVISGTLFSDREHCPPYFNAEDAEAQLFTDLIRTLSRVVLLRSTSASSGHMSLVFSKMVVLNGNTLLEAIADLLSPRTSSGSRSAASSFYKNSQQYIEITSLEFMPDSVIAVQDADVFEHFGRSLTNSKHLRLLDVRGLGFKRECTPDSIQFTINAVLVLSQAVGKAKALKGIRIHLLQVSAPSKVLQGMPTLFRQLQILPTQFISNLLAEGKEYEIFDIGPKSSPLRQLAPAYPEWGTVTVDALFTAPQPSLQLLSLHGINLMAADIDTLAASLFLSQLLQDVESQPSARSPLTLDLTASIVDQVTFKKLSTTLFKPEQMLNIGKLILGYPKGRAGEITTRTFFKDEQLAALLYTLQRHTRVSSLELHGQYFIFGPQSLQALTGLLKAEKSNLRGGEGQQPISSQSIATLPTDFRGATVETNTLEELRLTVSGSEYMMYKAVLEWSGPDLRARSPISKTLKNSEMSRAAGISQIFPILASSRSLKVLRLDEVDGFSQLATFAENLLEHLPPRLETLIVRLRSDFWQPLTTQNGLTSEQYSKLEPHEVRVIVAAVQKLSERSLRRVDISVPGYTGQIITSQAAQLVHDVHHLQGILHKYVTVETSSTFSGAGEEDDVAEQNRRVKALIAKKECMLKWELQRLKKTERVDSAFAAEEHFTSGIDPEKDNLVALTRSAFADEEVCIPFRHVV